MEEIVGLYGLRMWVEQSYKQVKGALGWAEYQVRSDPAIRRHWTLVCCAFTFCWWHASHVTVSARLSGSDAEPVEPAEIPNNPIAEKKNGQLGTPASACLVASRIAAGSSLVGALDDDRTVLARVVDAATTRGPAAVA